ncbi:MAG: hypothetical protein HC775_18295 [Hyellaceae cyanobacterium CSU_1_1]|nr:hypothetical protein [Hyellaceae cyanobacterium CSU_1_1]
MLTLTNTLLLRKDILELYTYQGDRLLFCNLLHLVTFAREHVIPIPKSSERLGKIAKIKNVYLCLEYLR